MPSPWPHHVAFAEMLIGCLLLMLSSFAWPSDQCSGGRTVPTPGGTSDTQSCIRVTIGRKRDLLGGIQIGAIPASKTAGDAQEHSVQSSLRSLPRMTCSTVIVSDTAGFRLRTFPAQLKVVRQLPSQIFSSTSMRIWSMVIGKKGSLWRKGTTSFITASGVKTFITCGFTEHPADDVEHLVIAEPVRAAQLEGLPDALGHLQRQTEAAGHISGGDWLEPVSSVANDRHNRIAPDVTRQED